MPIVAHALPMTWISPADGGDYFFGYYNLCPWSPLGDRLLGHRATFNDRFPRAEDQIALGWIDPGRSEFECFATSNAWNWQQGAKLQWLDSPKQALDECWLIHNDIRTGRAVSVLRDGAGTEREVLSRPIYTVSPDRTEALSLNFARIRACRPEYGYAGLSSDIDLSEEPRHDGIWRIDLQSGKSELTVSLAEIVALARHPAGDGRSHYVIHAVYNPSGSRFLFLHRFERSDGITHTRLFTAARDGGGLRLLMEGMVSHFDWRDDETIVAWAGRRTVFADHGGKGMCRQVLRIARRGVRKMYYVLGKPRFLMVKLVGDSYHTIRDAEHPPIERFAEGLFLTDGHCTFNRGGLEPGRWFLTDGYPDMAGKLPLFLWDTASGQGFELARVPSPRHLDGELRVDLHPRFSRDARYVCVDMFSEGHRGIGIIDVSSFTMNGLAG